MLQRFASAALVACVAIAVAAAAVALTLPAPPEKLFRLLTLWCIGPAVWGVWAMVAPGSWVPKLLPVWGVFLGLVAGVLCEFVLKLPKQVFGIQFSTLESTIGVLVMAAFYAVLWLLVRAAYTSLSRKAPAAR
jgi:hypothetical protein